MTSRGVENLGVLLRGIELDLRNDPSSPKLREVYFSFSISLLYQISKYSDKR
jgi:hypothetical protein